MAEQTYTAFTTEDGEPWAVFVDGHVDPSTLDRDEMAEELAYIMGVDVEEALELLATGPAAAHHYIYDAHAAGDDSDEDYPWHFCGASTPSARPITGVRFDG